MKESLNEIVYETTFWGPRKSSFDLRLPNNGAVKHPESNTICRKHAFFPSQTCCLKFVYMSSGLTSYGVYNFPFTLLLCFPVHNILIVGQSPKAVLLLKNLPSMGKQIIVHKLSLRENEVYRGIFVT